MMRRNPCLSFILLAVLLALVLPETTAPGGSPACAAEAKIDPHKKPDEKADAAKKARDDEEYYELLRLFADALDQVDRNYVKEVSRRELMEAAVQGLLTKLDPYSNYIPPKELEQFRSGVESEFGGIGIQVTIENGQLKIISPLVGTPAYRAGLLAGDRIVKIEGKDTKGITLDAAVKKLKGKVGTEVTFTVRHAHDGSGETVTLKREIIHVQTVLGDGRKKDDSWDFLYDAEKKIGYIRVSAFSRSTAPELKKAMEELVAAKLKGLVIDLRFNPGGLLSSAIEVSDMFVSEGRIVSTEGRNAPKRVWDAHKADTYEGFPMAILVNKYSASASEIVAACLQDHKRAVIVGERTWGKGSVQNIIELEQGRSALKLTTAGYRRPSGKNIHRFTDAKDDDEWGVKPNDGFELKLTVSETGDLMRHQREVAIVASKKEPAPPEDGNGEPASEFFDPQLDRALQYIHEELGEKLAESDGAGEEKPEPKEPEKPQPKEDNKPDPSGEEKPPAKKQDQPQGDGKKKPAPEEPKESDPENKNPPESIDQ